MKSAGSDRKTAIAMANHIRRLLKDGGSAPHTAEVQHFFKEEIQSRGWYTKELRQVAVRVRRAILRDRPLSFLVAVSDQLFCGRVLEEKVFAVFLLQRLVDKLDQRDFELFESWLDRVVTWADHDALVSYLIGPMVLAEPDRAGKLKRWARSPNRWRRRAAAVALIRAVRRRQLLDEVERCCLALSSDADDMVQKGLGWLLRETSKACPRHSQRLLARLRHRLPRLVLRIACETLPSAARLRILERPS